MNENVKTPEWELAEEGYPEDEPMPVGEHIVTLEGVKQVRVTDKYSQEEDGKTEKAIWRFTNDAGQVHNEWTKLKYGNEKAGLTKLLNRMIPGMAREMFGPHLIESLIGQKFKAIVEKVPGDNDYYAFAFIAPLTAPPPPAKPQAKPAAAPVKTVVAQAVSNLSNPAPIATPGSGNARILALRERLIGYGWPKATAISMLKAVIGDQSNTDGIDQYEECLNVLDQNRLELVQRGHSEENAASLCRQYVTDPAKADLMDEFEEKIRNRAFDLELEGASPDPDVFADPWEDTTPATAAAA